MKNFLRALRYAWPYRGRILLSMFCAMVAAVLWSLNFTAIYPVLTVLVNKQSMHDWINGKIAQTQKDIDGWQGHSEWCNKRLKELENQPPNPLREKEKRDLARDLAKLQGRLESATTDRSRYLIAKKYIDSLLPADGFQTLALVVGMVLLGVAIRGFFEFGQQTLLGSVVNLSLFDLRNRFYRNVIHLDVNDFGEEGTSELMARFTNDMQMLGEGIKTLFGKVVAEPLKALACVVIACWISWQLTLMFLILVPIALIIVTKVGRVMKRATRRLLERMSNIYKILQETFQGIRIVKAYTMEPYERRRFCNATKDYYRKSMIVVNLDALADPVIEFLGMLAVALALLAGAYLVLQKEMHLFGLRLSDQPLEAEALLQLYTFLAAIADPVRKLSSVYNRIQSGAAASDRIFRFLDRIPRVQGNCHGPRLTRHQDTIEFRGVCFSYEPGQPVLSNLNLTVHCGETIALVGHNGCGKTTMVGLVPRFYDPDHGSILVDGQDIRKAHLRSLRQQIGVVTQEPFLFEDTIFNNIAYGSRRASPEEVEQASRRALAHDFILKQPNGYDTRIGEGGFKLSGGQRQRLALARAMLRDPRILILDEFTSQTDPQVESDLHRILKDLMRNRTTFIITHRLNTLEIADRIVVLQQGRIESVGTHAELLRNCPTYQRLQESQLKRLSA